MTAAELMGSQAWLVMDDRCRPAAIRTEEHFDLAILPDGWSVQRTTQAEALAAVIAEDGRRRAAR